LESRYNGKRVFTTFIMPMIILAIRIEIEHIFKSTYAEFFSKENHEKVLILLILNDWVDCNEVD
jgi:hypothetical protein